MTTIYYRPGDAKARGWLTYNVSSETATSVVYKFSMGIEVDSSVTTSKTWFTNSIRNFTGTGGVVEEEVEYAKGKSGTVTGLTWSVTFTKSSEVTTYRRALEAGYYITSSSEDSGFKEYTLTIPAASTKYTITYNTNGGTGGPSNTTYYEGYPTTVGTSKPTKANYSFQNWLGSDGITYTPGATVPVSGIGNITLTAQWDWVGDFVSISYNSNGHGTAPASTWAYNSEASSSVYTWSVASMSDVAPYKFLGWSTSSSATFPTYYGGSTGSTSSSLYLYAVWQYQPQSYTITYNTMGGYNGPPSQTWQCTSESGTSVTLSSTTPTKAGFTFQGWSKTSSVTSTSGLWQPSQSVTLTNSDGDFTLYAIWTPDTTDYTYTQGSQVNSLWRTFVLYKVTNSDLSATVDVKTGLYIDGGQTTTSFVNNLMYNGSISQSSNQSATTRLKGLYLIMNEKTFAVAKTATSQEVTVGSVLYAGTASSTTSSVTISITISEAPSVEITYDPNGGSGEPPTGYKVQGVTYYIGHEGGTQSGAAIEPVKASHSFVGWATSASAQTAEYPTGYAYTTDSPLNLYAVWGDSYTETTVQGVSNATDICEWKNNTIAAISGTSVYQIDVGGNVVSTTTITSYTGSAKMCYSNGVLVIATSEYTAFIANDGSITYDISNLLTNVTSTTYGLFGINDVKGLGTLTVPSR